MQHHGCIRAQQPSEARKSADTAFRNTLTAFLAAGAVLMPHPSLAVSGGGGTSGARIFLLHKCASADQADYVAGLGTPHNYEDLSHKDLKKNAYTKAELRQTNFSYSDLSGVSLFGALAKGANFEGATLRATDLESCDLEDADFTNAVLEGAMVTLLLPNVLCLSVLTIACKTIVFAVGSKLNHHLCKSTSLVAIALLSRSPLATL